MKYKAALVFTTIFDPVVLEDYFKNFVKYDHLDSVYVIVIIDKKTPKKIFQRCEKLKKRGLKIFCPTSLLLNK